VMAIIIVIMAVSLPTLDAMYGDTRIRGAADEVRGAWADARARSIDDGVPYKFAVMPGQPRFRIAPDSPGSWDGASDSGHDSDDGKVKTGTLPKPVTFEQGDGGQQESGGWLTLVTFLPDGTCKDDASVAVKEQGYALIVVVSVRGLTGSVSVEVKK